MCAQVCMCVYLHVNEFVWVCFMYVCSYVVCVCAYVDVYIYEFEWLCRDMSYICM